MNTSLRLGVQWRTNQHEHDFPLTFIQYDILRIYPVLILLDFRCAVGRRPGPVFNQYNKSNKWLYIKGVAGLATPIHMLLPSVYRVKIVLHYTTVYQAIRGRAKYMAAIQGFLLLLLPICKETVKEKVIKIQDTTNFFSMWLNKTNIRGIHERMWHYNPAI